MRREYNIHRLLFPDESVSWSSTAAVAACQSLLSYVTGIGLEESTSPRARANGAIIVTLVTVGSFLFKQGSSKVPGSDWMYLHAAVYHS